MRNLIIFFSSLIVILHTSCGDQLDALPTSAKVDDNLIVDQKSAEIALNGAYYTYALSGTDYYDILSTRCANDYELKPARFSGIITYYSGALEMESHVILPTSYLTGDLWFGNYQALAASNGVITQMEKAPDIYFSGNRKQEILGEARLLRAFSHYNLLRWYAQYYDINSEYGVLLRTEAVLTGNIAKDRSSVSDSYNYILEDIEYAINNCVDANSNHYLNKWVAKGLKARVLMMRGQAGDYDLVATITDDIITNSPYQLEENLEDLFHQKGLDSKEVMFGIKPNAGQSDKFSKYYYYYASQYYPTTPFLALLENDPRKSWLFTDIGTNGTVKYLVTKYIDKNKIASSTLEETQYQMRLSEIYLLRAEALVRSGGSKSDAKELLKKVMGHAGITDFTAVDNADTDDAILAQIFYEVLKNLFCESGRELEIMMRMPKNIVRPINPFCDAPNVMIMPIPTEEFRQNSLLKLQNPGYSKE